MADSVFPLRTDPFMNKTPYVQAAAVPILDTKHSPTELSLHRKSQEHPHAQAFHISDDLLEENFIEQFDVKKNRKQRKSSSTSVTSSFASRSAKSSYPLDDLTFAPAPPCPVESDHTMSQLMAEDEPDQKLPSYEKITHSGTCLSRISLISLVIKRWKSTFWITYGDRSLLFFRSQKHFDEWLTNKHLSRKERKSLIKLHINFVADFEDEDVQGYQISKMKTKWYRNGGLLRNFKLDRWYYDGGPTIAGAFASLSDNGVDDLHAIMMEMARRSPRNKKFMDALAETSYDDDHSHSEGVSVKSAPGYTTTFRNDVSHYKATEFPQDSSHLQSVRSSASC